MDASHRGRGIASAVIDESLSAFRGVDDAVAVAEAWDRRDGEPLSIALFRRLGWSEVARIENYWRSTSEGGGAWVAGGRP